MSCQIERVSSCSRLHHRLAMIPTYVLLLISGWAVSSVLSTPGGPVYLGYQDSFGQYSFGYSAPGSARSEVRTHDGATRGAYSYVDDSGVIHKTEYIADGVNGFRVIAPNLPQPPLPVAETPEVAAARAMHLQALEAASRVAQQKDSQPINPIDEQTQGNTAQVAENQIQAKSSLNLLNHSSLQESKNSSIAGASDENILEQSTEEKSPRLNETQLENATNQLNVETLSKASSTTSRIESPDSIKSGQPVPVYEIVPGSLEIRTLGVQQTSDAEGISEVGAASRSIMKADQPKDKSIESQETPARLQRPSTLPSVASRAAFVPVNVLPFTSTYSTFFRNQPFLPYVFYGIM